jgi:hypothetical protein
MTDRYISPQWSVDRNGLTIFVTAELLKSLRRDDTLTVTVPVSREFVEALKQ